MNLTKNFESDKEQIIEQVENLFNSFDILSIDVEHKQNQFFDCCTVSVYTLHNNTSGNYLNPIHAKHIMEIDNYLNDNDNVISIDTDFIFYFYDNCIQLFMQCYYNESLHNLRHLKTIYTTAETEIIKEIENLIK